MRQTISTIDIFATIAEAARLPRDAYASSPSFSLLAAGKGVSPEAPDRRIVAEVWPFALDLGNIYEEYQYHMPMGRFIAPLFALYDGDWKYIRGAGQNHEVLYNIVQDPEEKHDLSAEKPKRCAKMSALLDKWLEETPNNMPTFTDGYEKSPRNK